MRLTTSVVIAAVTLLLGIILGERHLWIPISVLAASLVDLPTRSWVASDKIGEWLWASTILKFVFVLIGFYANIGQLACIGVIIWWIIT